jgi:lipoic acid synthetase
VQDLSYDPTLVKKFPKVGDKMPSNSRPNWFKVPGPGGAKFEELRTTIAELNLHTVCEEAKCPNIGECWNGGTGTIMLLGDTCTRGCKFCSVKTSSSPLPPDAFEPFRWILMLPYHTNKSTYNIKYFYVYRVAEALSRWNLTYVVLTAVDRDDIVDGGANHFALTVELINKKIPTMLIECLVSDFAGNFTNVQTLALSGLHVYAHNIETIKRLQSFVRDRRATYNQSLSVLKYAKHVNPKLLTKTSIMLGLGETKDEVIEAMHDIRRADVDIITLGYI